MSFVKSRPYVLAALLLLLTFMVYVPALRGGFVWDDRYLLTENPLIQAQDGIRRFWLTTEPPEYLPLTNTLHWLEWRVSGGRPALHHGVNVLFHALSAVVLWQVLRRLAVPGAFATAMLFAVHPVAVASAAWISETKNTLSLFLSLLSLLAYLRAESVEPGEAGRMRPYLLSLFCFLLALLSKASVVMLPAVMLLCAWWRRGGIDRRDMRRTAPFFALSLILGLVTVWFQWHNAMQGESLRPEGWLSRVAATGWIIGFYLYKLIVPVNLCVIYPRWNIDGCGVMACLPLLGVAAGLAVFGFYRRSWGRGPLFATACFLAMVLPVLGLVDMAFLRLSLVADHLQYAAMPAILALGGAALARVSAARRDVGVLATVACVAALSGLTWSHAAVYAGEERLWQDNIARNREAWLAWNNLGTYYHRAGRPADAAACFSRVLTLNPGYAKGYFNRAGARTDMNQLPQAVEDCTQALALKPDFIDAALRRADILARLGRYDLALRDYDRYIERKTDSAGAYCGRGTVRARLGRYAEAVSDFDRAVALKPGFAEAYNNRAVSHYRLKAYEKALADVSAFQRLGGRPDPAFVDQLTRAMATPP